VQITAHSCHNLTYNNSVADTPGTGDIDAQTGRPISLLAEANMIRLRLQAGVDVSGERVAATLS
jgi:hypothetical protein